MNKINVDSIDDTTIKDNKDAAKDKEIEILSGDRQIADTITEKNEVANINDVIQNIVDNEDQIANEKAISIDTKEELINTVERVSNTNKKSIVVKLSLIHI